MYAPLQLICLLPPPHKQCLLHCQIHPSRVQYLPVERYGTVSEITILYYIFPFSHVLPTSVPPSAFTSSLKTLIEFCSNSTSLFLFIFFALSLSLTFCLFILPIASWTFTGTRGKSYSHAHFKPRPWAWLFRISLLPGWT